jgi:osmotically-inducible protein OsmY
MFRTLLIALVAALGAATLVGCASTDSGRRSAGQTVDDGAITARVKTAIAKDAGVGKAMDVNVTTNRGIVQLSGFVDSQEVADRAGRAARSVEGVQSVRNDIRVAARAPAASAGPGASSSPGAGSNPSSSNPQGSRPGY